MLVVLCLAAACGEDDGVDVSSDEETTTSTSAGPTSSSADDTTSTTPTSTETTATTATPTDAAEDQEIADAAVAAFEEAVLAQGFVLDPDEEDQPTNDDGTESEFVSDECEVFDEAFAGDELPGSTANAESHAYERGDLFLDGGAESAMAVVGVVDDAARLDEIFTLYRDERLPGCLEESLGPPADPAARQIDVEDGPPVGDDAIAIHLADLEGEAPDTIAFTTDMTFVHAGRAAVTIVSFTVGDAEPTFDSAAALEAVVAELAALS